MTMTSTTIPGSFADPPLVLTIGLDDQGLWDTALVSTLPPGTIAALLLHVAASVLRQAPDQCQTIADTAATAHAMSDTISIHEQVHPTR